MAGHKSPLRDRLLSNSPDPIKSSILRESGLGWNSPPSNTSSSGSTGSITSPLRIAKRDSPIRTLPQPQVARRSSSSYKHVRNNNLVSKSPFKSQIPTPLSTPSRHAPIVFPSSRRVSGEKRPRPSSIHEQAENENERPFSLKRERKQSKTYQGLIEKEPVTKSPFKLRTPSTEEQPSLPPLPPTRMPPISVTSTSSLDPPVGASCPQTTGPFPARSSLVSRRMHGPRMSGSGRRGRRKTVTFDERCDVVEFDREDDSDEDRYGSAEEYETSQEQDIHQEDEPFFQGIPQHDEHDTDMYDMQSEGAENSSYESIQLSDIQVATQGEPSLLGMGLDPDTSISGLVDEIFLTSSSNTNTSDPTNNSPLVTDRSRSPSLPPNSTSEAPTQTAFGSASITGRFLQHRRSQSPHTPPHYQNYPQSSLVGSQHNYFPEGHPSTFNLPTHPSPHGPPATPPRRLSIASPATISNSPRLPATSLPNHHTTPPPSTTRSISPPLGRSTHIERVLKARSAENSIDVDMLPGSPSPIKATKRPVTDEDNPQEGWVPKFGLETGSSGTESGEARSSDPFALSGPVVPTPIFGEGDSSEFMDSANLSIGASEVGFRSTDFTDGMEGMEHSAGVGGVTFASSFEKGSLQSNAHTHVQQCHEDDDSVAAISHHSSVSSLRSSRRSSTPNLYGGVGDRPRIDRDEVKRRLMQRQGTETPDLYDAAPTDQEVNVDLSSLEDDREDKDRMSVITTMTDFSTETAIVERAEKRNLSGTNIVSDGELGFLGASERLQFDFGSKFGSGGLGIGSLEKGRSGVIEPKGRLGASNADTGSIASGGSMRMGDVDVDMDMRSALDRLMDDVAGTRADDSLTTEEDDSYVHEPQASSSVRPPVGRAATDSTLLHNNFTSRDPSGSSVLAMPPPVPPKDNIRSREQLIIEKRREAKRMEEEESLGYYTPPKAFGGRSSGQARLGIGRPSRRRSMSTGDVDGGAKERGKILLDVAGVGDSTPGDDALGDSIEKELKKLVGGGPPKSHKYQVREREGTIYASSSDPDRFTHLAGPGDVNIGKAWRPVRRPSDMNEYSKQIKEYRAQEKPGKAYGKVFVKVLGVKGIHVPLPQQPTAMTCTLNNGIHYVSTPECPLGRDSRIEQEFELIEHSKLEFTLTLKVRRDPHIIAQFKALAPAPAPLPPPPVVQTSSKGGMRSFFSSSPKKVSKDKFPVQPPPPPLTQRLPENLARYLKSDGTLARAFVSFKDIASHCDTRLFETSYPLIGQRAEVGGKISTLQVGEIVLQMFRLPPLPGISPEQLPQSLEECHRGLRHINWHKVTYFEGTLTQSGGDCSTWRRRQLRVIGANLVAFNDVTKRATATIDLKKAIAVEDDQESRSNVLSPIARSSRYADEYDGLGGVERSFRLIFPHEQEITFFADTDEEKSRWLDVLRALVGHIPPHPLWAELLWQRQDDLAKMASQSSRSPHPSSPYTNGRSHQR